MQSVTQPVLVWRPYENAMTSMAAARSPRPGNEYGHNLIMYSFTEAIKLLGAWNPSDQPEKLVQFGEAIFATCWSVGYAGVILPTGIYPGYDKLIHGPGNRYVADLAGQYLSALAPFDPATRKKLEMAVFMPLMDAARNGRSGISDCIEVCSNVGGKDGKRLLRALMRVTRLPEFPSRSLVLAEAVKSFSHVSESYRDILSGYCLKACIYLQRGSERLRFFHRLCRPSKNIMSAKRQCPMHLCGWPVRSPEACATCRTVWPSVCSRAIT